MATLALRLEEIIRHVLLVGMTGTGKTCAIYNLIAGVQGKAAVWIWDIKGDFTWMACQPNFRFFHWSDVRWNILRPPHGVTPIHWLQCFADFFTHAFDLLSASKGFLLYHLRKLYEMFGVFEGSDRYPCLFDAMDYFSGLRVAPGGPDRDYLTRVLNRFRFLCVATGQMFGCERGFPLEELEECNVVFDINGLTEEAQSFLIEAMLFFEYARRLETRSFSPLVVVIDEAKRIFDIGKEKRVAAGVPSLDILVSRLREFKTGLVVADQQPSRLAQSLLANTNVKIAFRLGDSRDVRIMASAMGLDSEQAEKIKDLPDRVAIVKVGSRG